MEQNRNELKDSIIDYMRGHVSTRESFLLVICGWYFTDGQYLAVQPNELTDVVNEILTSVAKERGWFPVKLITIEEIHNRLAEIDSES